ncbi:MAG TPA: efflux RND transporter periplasmic adaptor subunit [Chitinispirillaceae bacterium]|nr:efflux RND transporter periplasmic adaptor subunit [Chitinispirillaceae bacterium]
MIHRLLIITATVFLAMTAWSGCDGVKEQEHDDHGDNVHTEKPGETDSHAGHGEHEGEEAGAHGDEGEIALTPEIMKMAGITVAKAEIGRINSTIELSGEIGFNEDRLVHISPRFPGIVKEIRYKIGEYVNAGETVAVIESNESMTTYSLKAPISGRIIEKNVSVGEHVSVEKSLYLLADLSAVWVNLAVYPKDIARVQQGQKVTITSVGAEGNTIGTISYVTPIMDAQTRKITARVVLPNANNIWRPGTFVNATIETGDGEPGLTIDRDAVQILDNKNIVFVQHEPGMFKPVQVKTGEKNSRKIMILSGLLEGQEYINSGAFDLKAKIVTSSMGAHAGHNH